LYLWDLTAKNPAATKKNLWTTDSEFKGIAIGADARLVVVTKKALRVGNLDEEPVFHESFRVLPSYQMARISPDSRYVITTHADYTARVWDATLQNEPRALRTHRRPITSVEISPDGRWAVTIDHQLAQIWELAADNSVAISLGAGIRTVAFSPDSRWLVTLGAANITQWYLTAKGTDATIDASEEKR
jgi:WD40 repeat protein